jgi:hypothetical protein
MTYRVYSTPEKVYIERPKGCVARLCNLSAEFFEHQINILDCSFERFQEEAKLHNYIVEECHRPDWAKNEFHNKTLPLSL